MNWRRRTYQVVQDLVTNDLNHFKRLGGCNRVNENITVDSNEMLGVQNRVLILKNPKLATISFPSLERVSFELSM